MLSLQIEEARKRSTVSLFSDNETQLPDYIFGESMPIGVSLGTRIAQPITSQLFDPVDVSAWEFRAGLGLGFTPPIAGTYFIQSGVALTSGTLTSGKRYKIVSFVAGDSFTNVGAASNATDVLFTASGTTPTTWTHSSELQEITANLAFDATAATINTALTATAWITAAGGVTVAAIDGSTDFFTITFTSVGSRTEMVGDGGNLAPLSDADIGTLLNGDAQTEEVQTLRISQQPATYVDLTTAFDSAGVTVSAVQTGGGGLNAKVRFTLDPLPYSGQWTVTVRGIESAVINFDAAASDVVTALENISITSGTLTTGAKYKIVTFVALDVFTNVGAASNATGVVFTATGTTPTTWTHGSTLSPVAAGNVNVSKEATGQYLVTFQGDMANTAMGTLSASASGLLVLTGKSGELPLDVPGVEILLGDETETTATFSIRGRPTSGDNWRVIFFQTVTLKATIFTPGSETPQPRDQYLKAVVLSKALGNAVDTGSVDFSSLGLLSAPSYVIALTVQKASAGDDNLYGTFIPSTITTTAANFELNAATDNANRTLLYMIVR